MSRHLCAAAAQLGPIGTDEPRRAVVERLVALLRAAAARGCSLVVFPDMALTPFFPRREIDVEAAVARYFETEMPGPETRPLFEEAARLGVGFYLGYCELAGEEGARRRFNTSILVDGRGRILGKYRKVHLPGPRESVPGLPFQHLEKRYFEPGDLGFPVWNAFGGTMGMCICNDRRWPETYRMLALQGAEVVALSTSLEDALVIQNMDLDLSTAYKRFFDFQENRRPDCYGLIASPGPDKSAP